MAVLLLAPLHGALADTTPRVLSQSDAETYRKIFDLQEAARWGEADRLIRSLKDQLLMGHVLAQRYLHRNSGRTGYDKLHGWMKSHADHPDAETIFKLARKRRPKNGWKPLAKPRVARLSYSESLLDPAARQPAKKPVSSRRTSTDLKILKQVRRNVLRDRMTVTEKMLTTRGRSMSPAALAEARSMLARGHLSAHRFERALKQAELAMQGQGGGRRLGAYRAGLALWAMGRQTEALGRFRVAASTLPDRIGNLGGAIDYWHARAALANGQFAEAIAALEHATAWPRDLYGQLAHAQLARLRPYDWSQSEADNRIIRDLMQNAPIRRAMALSEAGQVSRAEDELSRLSRRAGRDGDVLLLTVADAMAAPSTAYRMARVRLNHYGEAKDTSLYPVPRWRTVSDERINLALVLAVARRESGYNPTARSHVGARGLMQLMPGTASYIARKNGFPSRDLRRLNDPEISLKFGHAYLTYLSKLVRPRGCLIHMLAAYNAGPGTLKKWEDRFGDRHDPLLFIELMGSGETRRFVRSVLAAYWIYRDRLDQPVPSQDMLAAGQWPTLPGFASAALTGPSTGETADAD